MSIRKFSLASDKNADITMYSYIADNIVMPDALRKTMNVYTKLISTTSYSSDFSKGFLPVFPASIDIFNNSIQFVQQIPDSILRNNTCLFISKMMESLYAINKITPLNNVFSRPTLSLMDHDSIMIEWIYKQFRAGFSVELEITDSSAFYVLDNKDTGSFETFSQRLSNDNFDYSVNKIVEFVVRNT